MLLFVLFLHPMISRLEQTSGAELVVAYADDVSIIVTSIQQIETARNIFSSFGRVSGARLNLTKTTATDIGFINGNALNVPWLRTENQIKILGVVFTKSIKNMINTNWDAVVSKFTQQLWMHKHRLLTLHQKITLLNTFITSKIW